MGLVGFTVWIFKDHSRRIMARRYRRYGDRTGRMVRFVRAHGIARNGRQYDYWRNRFVTYDECYQNDSIHHRRPLAGAYEVRPWRFPWACWP